MKSQSFVWPTEGATANKLMLVPDESFCFLPSAFGSVGDADAHNRFAATIRGATTFAEAPFSDAGVNNCSDDDANPRMRRPRADEYDGGGEWLWKRQVLDDQLKWGHAVVCANLDNDEAQELIIGVRDDANDEHRRGLRLYDPQDDAGSSWKRTIVDPGSVAIEDLAAADLNGDGRIDVVAVGRQTHNVKIYWNETK